MVIRYRLLSFQIIVAFAITAFLGFSAPSQTFAEDLIYFEPHTGHTEVVDSNNLGRFAISGESPHALISDKTRSGNLTFAITYADVTAGNGNGFDDASLGATRRATLETVFTYLNDVLNETTSATIAVQIEV
ncbi:MAG: hypothetical protein VCC01_09765, partial [Candidatus Hydrogenedentota bacterium]